jgi:hypothetical protein
LPALEAGGADLDCYVIGVGGQSDRQKLPSRNNEVSRVHREFSNHGERDDAAGSTFSIF